MLHIILVLGIITGPIKFQSKWASPDNFPVFRVVLADYDNDGDLDILTSGWDRVLGEVFEGSR